MFLQKKVRRCENTRYHFAHLSRADDVHRQQRRHYIMRSTTWTQQQPLGALYRLITKIFLVVPVSAVIRGVE